MPRRSVIVAAVAAGALAVPTSASAHVHAVSKKGSKTSASVTFSGKISGGKLTVKKGSRTVSGSTKVGSKKLSVRLRGARRGTYKASWRIVASDGHSQRGSWTFKVH